MEQSGIKVYRYRWEDEQKMQYAQLSTLIALTIERWYQENDSEYYIVTDPDIELDHTNGDILEFYKYLLELFPRVQVVGPMLRIDDIPDCYPRKQDVLKRHAAFWNTQPFRVEYNGRFFEVQGAFIDTTFGMYRKAFRFKNYNPGIRTCPPYAARHLDWYLDPENMTEDQIYYAANASPKIVHWGLIQPMKHQSMSSIMVNGNE